MWDNGLWVTAGMWQRASNQWTVIWWENHKRLVRHECNKSARRNNNDRINKISFDFFLYLFPIHSVHYTKCTKPNQLFLMTLFFHFSLSLLCCRSLTYTFSSDLFLSAIRVVQFVSNSSIRHSRNHRITRKGVTSYGCACLCIRKDLELWFISFMNSFRSHRIKIHTTLHFECALRIPFDAACALSFSWSLPSSWSLVMLPLPPLPPTLKQEWKNY